MTAGIGEIREKYPEAASLPAFKGVDLSLLLFYGHFNTGKLEEAESDLGRMNAAARPEYEAWIRNLSHGYRRRWQDAKAAGSPSSETAKKARTSIEFDLGHRDLLGFKDAALRFAELGSLGYHAHAEGLLDLSASIYEQAIGEGKKLPRLSPTQQQEMARVHLDLIDVYEKAGKPEREEPLYDWLSRIEAYQSNPTILLRPVQSLKRQKKWDEALDRCRELAARFPRDSGPWWECKASVVEIRAGQGQWKDAVELIQNYRSNVSGKLGGPAFKARLAKVLRDAAGSADEATKKRAQDLVKEMESEPPAEPRTEPEAEPGGKPGPGPDKADPKKDGARG